MVGDTLAFAPVAVGTEWFATRDRTTDEITEALIPPGRSGSSLPFEFPRPCWSVVTWDVPTARRLGGDSRASSCNDATVLEALLWCDGAESQEQWVIDSTSVYIGYLIGLLRDRSRRGLAVSRSTTELLGDPALDLIRELRATADELPRLRRPIGRSLLRRAGLSLDPR